MEKKGIITIDGSAWTGKSTVSAALAKVLGYQRLNTGSMFRAVAYLKRENNFSDGQQEELIKIIENTTMDFVVVEGESRFFVNQRDFTDIVKDNSLVPLASTIAHIPQIRTTLLQMQREIGAQGGFVVEGRDTGTAVFPDADWKFFLDAKIDIKVKRFFKLLPENKKGDYTQEQVQKIVEETDRRDRERKIAPLKMPEDAIYYDNSDSPTAEQDAIVLWYYMHGKKEILKNVLNLLAKVK